MGPFDPTSSAAPAAIPMSPMEMQVQQAAIDRQRQLALALQQQSLTPTQGQMVSGHYVAPNPLEYLSKLAGGLMGKYQQNNLDDKQLDIAKQYSKALYGQADSVWQNNQGGQPQAAPQPNNAPPQQSPTQNNAMLNPDYVNETSKLLGQDESLQNANQSPGPKATDALVDSLMQKMNPQQPVAQPTQPTTQPVGGGLLSGISHRDYIAYQMNPTGPNAEMIKARIALNSKNMEQGDLVKKIVAAGIDPNSAQGQAIITQNIKKENYMAPTPVKAGGFTLDSNGNVMHYPTVAEGSQAFHKPDGTFEVKDVTGAATAITTSAAAKARGAAQYDLVKTYNPATNQMEFTPKATVADGVSPDNPQQSPSQQPQPITGPQTGRGSLKLPALPAGSDMPVPQKMTPSTTIPPTVQQSRNSEQLGLLVNERNNPNNTPEDNAALDRSIARVKQTLGAQQPAQPQTRQSQRFAADAPLGAVAAADAAGKAQSATKEVLDPNGSGSRVMMTDAEIAKASQGGKPVVSNYAPGTQESLDKKWEAQQAKNRDAQTTISYLQNIKDNADRAATGRFTDRIQFTNGLLSLVGDKKATTQEEANQLMQKNGALIVTRLSQMGMNTDAARDIAESSTPNAKMNVGAIKEAADNIIGAQKMEQARTNLLQKHGDTRNPIGYSQTENQFNKLADPTIFQAHNIADPTTRRAFIQNQLKKDPTFLDRYKQLQTLGVFN